MRRWVCALVAAGACGACPGGAGAGRALDVAACGADPTGGADCTALLQELHARGVPLYYPNGTYRFNGETLDFSGGVAFESPGGVVVRNDVSEGPVVVMDDAGRLVGLQQNPLELDERALGPGGRMRSGSLVPPPLSGAVPGGAVDVVAHWYNDGGLECRRAGGGWRGWYYWSWAFHAGAAAGGGAGEAYDPARHPLLGFYRGDDPRVLDWQCFWLAEYGVRAVALCSGAGGVEGWERPEGEAHWVYQLFHHVPNFRRLEYVLWGPSPWAKGTEESRRAVEGAWARVVEGVYLRYGNFYAMERGGRRYPVLFVYEGEALRGVFDGYRGAEGTAAFLGRVAERFRGAGYGGVALLVRHGTSERLLDRAALEGRGVLYLDAAYSEDYGTGGTYAERVASFAPPSGRRAVVNVCTARHSRAPHPSRWVCPGSTPALFGEVLRKAVAHVLTNGMPRVVTCYNVAEWAEGGPGLQPNRRDRFGYLQAVRDAVGGPRRGGEGAATGPASCGSPGS